MPYKKDEQYLFSIRTSIWLKMKDIAEKYDLNNNGIYDKRSDAINLWASPEDKPVDWIYPMMTGALKYPRSFIATVYTKPSIVLLELTKPIEATKIKTLQVYADFTGSDGKDARNAFGEWSEVEWRDQKDKGLYNKFIDGEISKEEYERLIISESEHKWAKQKIVNLKEMAELVLETESINKTEIDNLTEESIKNLSEEEKGVLEILERVVNGTIDEVLRLAKLSASATYTNQENKLYQYNAGIMVKYCHLMGGIWHLLTKNNYLTILIIERSMYEISMYLRYFYLHPDQIQEYEDTSGNKKKFSNPKIIKGVLANEKDFNKQYAYYRFLCNANHPSTKLTILLGASETIDDKENKKIHAKIEFNPLFDKGKYFMTLLTLINYNRNIIETEYDIFKKLENLKPNTDLLKLSDEILIKLRHYIIWLQKGVRLNYATLKNKDFKDINKPFLELGVDKEEVIRYIDNLQPIV